MSEFLTVVGALTMLALAAGVGFYLGSRRILRRWNAHDERLARITGEVIRTGEPHNHDGPPARVTQGRMRNRRNWSQ